MSGGHQKTIKVRVRAGEDGGDRFPVGENIILRKGIARGYTWGLVVTDKGKRAIRPIREITAMLSWRDVYTIIGRDHISQEPATVCTCRTSSRDRCDSTSGVKVRTTISALENDTS